MDEQCEDCGAVRPLWLGGPHKCHAKFVRKTYNSFQSQEVVEPHSAEEYETGFLRTGWTSFDFGTP